ncbi:hypothetical protein FDP41_006108 [Naegleria fowleri]|uniref:AB hydrolase-1 domain-containing protein n=1 Tax=Naegleria fowleri TaxID=5763 RepID=A0A6A5BKQ3_NAEFO|nr:uncharacterized protein FDP41_006108 [Naegleria fowleri]KAF0974634.1 hypothetical protein FDP41_006108 [Naegleria fowleri]
MSIQPLHNSKRNFSPKECPSFSPPPSSSSLSTTTTTNATATRDAFIEDHLPRFHQHQQDEVFSSENENPFRIDRVEVEPSQHAQESPYRQTSQISNEADDTNDLKTISSSSPPPPVNLEFSSGHLQDAAVPSSEWSFPSLNRQPKSPSNEDLQDEVEGRNTKSSPVTIRPPKEQDKSQQQQHSQQIPKKIVSEGPSQPQATSVKQRLIKYIKEKTPFLAHTTTEDGEKNKTIGWETSQDTTFPKLSKIISPFLPGSSSSRHISHRKQKISGSWWNCIHGIFKFSTLALLYMEIVYIVIFLVSLIHSTQNEGFFAGGNALNVLWLSIAFLILNTLFIWDGFGDVFMTYCFYVCCRKMYLNRMERRESLTYSRKYSITSPQPILKNQTQNSSSQFQNSSAQPRVQIQQVPSSDSRPHTIHYYSPFMYYEWKLVGFIVICITLIACFILIFIIFVCDAFLGNDRVSGWFACCFFISILAFFFISMHEYIIARHNNKYVLQKLAHHHQLVAKWDFWTLVKFSVKFLCMILMWLVLFGLLLLLAMQSVFTAKTLSYSLQSGGAATMVTIKPPKSSRFQLHLYCEGRQESDDIVLLDADVGIACPKCYYHDFMSLLAQNNIRVCVLERGGYGFSNSGPFPRNLGNVTASEVGSLMKDNFLGQPVVMISHSSATFTTRTLLHYYPKLLRGVILLHPAHEQQEEMAVKMKIIESNRRQYFVNQLNSLRYVTALGLTQLFPSLIGQLNSHQEGLYARYYLGGVKSYVLSFPMFSQEPNSNISIQYASILHLTNYVDACWSETFEMPSVFEHMKILRREMKDGRFFEKYESMNRMMYNGTRSIRHYPIPLIILTSRFLMNGTCEENGIFPQQNIVHSNSSQQNVRSNSESSNLEKLCTHWKEHQPLYAKLYHEMHRDLFHYYSSSKTKWEFVEADYDMALTRPSLLMPYVKQVLEQSKIT